MASLFNLTGRVAIVTGSSRGIGRAIAERLAEYGASVVISSRKAEACAETAATINRALGRNAATPIAANISSKEELQHLVDETIDRPRADRYARVQRGFQSLFGALAGITDDPFRKILDNNVLANHWLDPDGRAGDDRTQGRRGHHRLVDRRAQGLEGHRRLQISKAADIQLARNLAVEWGRHNVRVNCIAPGLVRTDFARAFWENPETLKAVSATTPLGRIGEPDEIAGAAVFLASGAGTSRPDRSSSSMAARRSPAEAAQP